MAREYALKALVMVELGGNDPEYAMHYLLQENPLSDRESSFCCELAAKTIEKKEELDKVIVQYLHNWQLDRLSAVIRSILRLGTFELLYLPDIPVSVTINEYIEISKLYQDEESAGFVNGILDNIKKKTGKSLK